MTKRLSLRFLILICMLALLALSAPPETARAEDCTICRRACVAEYRSCVEAGASGCDLVAAECLESCCPDPAQQ